MRIIVLLVLIASLAHAAPEIGFDTDILKFGYISEGGEHSRSLKVSNSGDEALAIDSLIMPDAAYTLTAPSLPNVILQGDTAVFIIRFHPDETRSYNGTFTFQCNDPVNPNATVSAEAQGIPVFIPGQMIWSYQGVENVVTCTAVDDVDGDGFPDVIAESYDAGAPQQDHLFCISGSGLQTGNVIWSARPLGGPSNSGGYGDDCLKVTEDLNGNGTDDLIYGTAWGSRSIFALESSTGGTIWSYDTYANPPSGDSSGWIYSVNPIPDLDGDNIPEVLAGAGSNANAGYCLSGADGSLLWKKNAGDVIYATAAVNDVNDDGIPDAVFGSGDNDDKVYCVSGASSGYAQEIWQFNTGGASILAMDRIADIDDDGYDDVIAGSWYNNNRIFALSGHSSGSADTIWTTGVGFPIMKVVSCEDINGDSYEDILIASWSSYAEAISGRDGTSIWRYFCGDDVWAIYWAYDITGDGIVDVAAGSFTGSVYLIDGASGGLIWESPSEAKIFTVRPIKDVNGDGYDDVIAGQQMPPNGTGGRFFVISGGTVEPTSTEEEITGLPEDYRILSNYPNPFNARTTISFVLPEAAGARIDIYNIAGQRIRTLTNSYWEAGEHSITWDARNNYGNEVATGVYFYKLDAGTVQKSQKMTLIK
jgi:hypothetical protein